MKEKYIVKKDQRVVICILSHCSYDAINAFDGHAGEYTLPVTHPKFLIKDTYKGVAKCSPEDEWDETIGKRLAYRRAFTEYKRDFCFAFEHCERLVESCLSNAKKWFINHYEKN